MRLLILLAKNPKENLLVRLHTEDLIKEIKDFINKRRYSEAISAALTKGNLEKKVKDHELGSIDADAVLSKDKVMWDLKK